MAECTIYDKLRYIAETKDLIKAAIQAQDVEVLESATFRQYAEYITEIRKVSSVNGMQGDVTITAEDLGALTEIPSEYITETELNEKGYLTAVPDVYITEDELSSQMADKVSQNGLNEAIEGVRNDIPTNVSELTNDSGYITLNEVPKQDLSGYALKTDIPDISVKQDKLTAGNGISITDNVISLDYEFDLFEVVQSLPTDNISDNKVYLVLDSNGNEGNTYLEYLYVDGKWEELGKFKVNIDLSGYATEQWVNEQGFIKEHQDISNLATKEELNAKQDVITDLESIRSGASKGATALQEVPDTYALKTDILSAKTDTRYTTYDVQNPVLSGNTIVLQNEVTDSRKYHTLGFEKNVTTTEIGPVQKYVRFYGEVDETGSPIVDTNFDDYQNIPLDFSNITDDGDQIIIHYYGSYANMDYEAGTRTEGDSFEVYITYNRNTKILNGGDGTSNGFLQFSRSDTSAYVFQGNTQYDCSQLPEGVYLIWHIYISPYLHYTLNVETHDRLFVGETTVSTPTSRLPQNKNEFFRYENNVKAYILTDKNTTFKTINGEQITGNGNIEVAANVDLSDYATKEEVNAKQDTLVSGTNIKTINGNSILGSGNITIEGGEDSADLSDYYTKTETNALVNPKLEQVTLTQEAYDALTTKEDNVLYVISDAEDFKFKTINGEQIIGEGNIEVAANVDLSSYATKEELNAKQDVITDLGTIRSGAAKGATALQEVPSTYALKSDIPDITTKQDTLVSGTNIKTINGISLLGEGNITIEGGEGGSDLSGYYTKAEIDAMIGGASATISEINDLVV